MRTSWGMGRFAWVVFAASVSGCPAPVVVVPDGGPIDSGPPGCRVDADCDDGAFCSGVERCQPGSDLADGRGCVTAVAPACMPTQTCDEAMDACLSDCDLMPDADDDGHDSIDCGGDDCDDASPLRSPSRTEVCDADDRDEDCDPTTFGDRDRDRDTFFDASCCNVAGAVRTCGTDCDDAYAAVSPVASEACDGRDNDCDAMVDETVLIPGFADLDGDLHGDPTAPLQACPGAIRFSLVGDDCDDGNGRVHGAQVEVCDGLDNDCNDLVDDRTREVTWYRDADGDRFGSVSGGTMISCDPPAGYELLPLDCDDGRAGTNPIADETCNGRDDDCDGRANYALGPGDTEDDDGDGFVDAACGGLGDDCDDGDDGVHPGAEAYCDGRDYDCDGVVDDGVPVDWFRDEDGDGWGAGTAMVVCDPPTGYVRRDGDCDDSLPGRSPSEPDDCDGIDDDCDGMFDENANRLAFYADSDGDGAGGGAPMLACAQPAGYGLFPTDCDDTTTLRYEGALELCDGIDNDCDGTPDDAADVVCTLAGADATCVAGTCELSSCRSGFADCDADDSSGCEVDVRIDPLHCGGCPTACPFGSSSTATCSAGTCGLSCDAGAADCDGTASNGCESILATDPEDCGSCGVRCAPREHATPTCVAGRCATSCESGWSDCDGMTATGCEIQTDADVDNCGGCGVACPLAGDACIRGMCVSTPFESDGTEGPFAPTASVVLAPGVHHFTTISIPAGVVVTTSGTGRLELLATGDVSIAGTIDLSGGDGSSLCGGNAGGTTGAPIDSVSSGGGSCGAPPAPGGEGGAGGDGPWGRGGMFGGGGTGSGGGGYAGGAGGDSGGGRNGAGGSVLPGSHGGVFDGEGGAPALEGTPLALYAGRHGCLNNGQAGGGSIGEDAAMDLGVATTFRPGSGGGGGRGGGVCGNGGAGGGGGGGALRISSPTRILIATTGVLRADGGRGSAGGSGGVIYLAAPELEVRGIVSAVGGQGATVAAPPTCPLGTSSGDGGLGRIRLSVLPERCTLFGAFSPPLPTTGCARTPSPGTPGRVYVDTYPF